MDYPNVQKKIALPDIKTGPAFHAYGFERIPFRLIDQPPIESKGNLAKMEKADLVDTGYTIKGRVASLLLKPQFGSGTDGVRGRVFRCRETVSGDHAPATTVFSPRN